MKNLWFEQTKYLILVLISSIILFGFNHHSYADETNSSSISKFSIQSAGASFPYPLIDHWRTEYEIIHPEININYQSIGSGGGIKQHIEHTIHFAATDVPLTENEAKLAPNTLHIPETLGAIAIIYNIPEIPHKGLKLTGVNLAEIYMGKITTWNDPKIQINNKTVNLPDAKIIPVRRSDSSGTTFVFTDYLSKLSAEFDVNVGAGKSVPLGIGVAVLGNEGISSIVASTPFSIGYVELAYALQTNSSFAYIENADKTNFVEPTMDSISSAASMMVNNMPRANDIWDDVTIINSPGINSYPLSSFTYLIIYEDLINTMKSKDHAIALANLFYWMLTDGQIHSSSLFYAPLPQQIVKLGIDGISNLKYDGKLLVHDNESNIIYDNDNLNLPTWIRDVAKWWVNGMISDLEYINHIRYLLNNELIKL